MARSLGTVWQRKYRAVDGTIKQCRTWSYRFYSDGMPIEGSFRVDTQEEAERMLAEHIASDGGSGIPDDVWNAFVIVRNYLSSRNMIALMKHRSKQADKALRKKFQGRPPEQVRKMYRAVRHMQALQRADKAGVRYDPQNPHALYGTQRIRGEVSNEAAQ